MEVARTEEVKLEQLMKVSPKDPKQSTVGWKLQSDPTIREALLCPMM